MGHPKPQAESCSLTLCAPKPHLPMQGMQEGFLLFADVFVQAAAASAVFLLVLPTSVITTYFYFLFSPGLATPLGLATPGKATKGLLCPSLPSQVSNEQVL